VRWFGGGNRTSPRVPAGHAPLWPGAEGCWRVGQWAGHEIRVAAAGSRQVALIGTCGATAAELTWLAEHGVPDDAAWRWPGSYLVIERTPAATTIWTDLAAAWPVYTTTAGGLTYWASSSRALAGLTGAPVDLDRMAAWLLAPTVPALLERRSAFTGIDHVPAGHRLTIPRHGTPALARVWRPHARPGAATRLRDELAAAVTVRLEYAQRPTSDLSGGLDSTALAVLAAQQAKPGRMVAGVTVHPAGRTHGGDLDYATAVVAVSPLVHELVSLTSVHAPYTALDQVPVTDEPAPSTVTYARFARQMIWMREVLGTDCHFTGDGGDSLLCTPPIQLADLIATGRYRRGIAETLAWARVRRRAAWPLLAAATRAARTSRTASLATLARQLRAGATGAGANGDVGWYLAEPVPGWATGDARARAAAIADTCRVEEVPAGRFATTATAEGIAEVGRSARADIQLAEHHGVAVINPFTDSRLVDSYLALALDEQPGPAQYKPILRAALADLFPPELAARTTKGDFNPDHYGGLRANLPALHDLADGHLAAAGLVDPARFRHALTLAAAGHPGGTAAVETVIAAETWLRALDTAPPVTWQRTGHHQSQGRAA
jgi:asparagine synthase (glutamine-hydrolysing)